MHEKIKILVINPGSTSTKIAVFENETKLFGTTLTHEAATLNEYKNISDQYLYRKEAILRVLEKEGFALADFGAFVGRCANVHPCAGGTYEVSELMLEHARTNAVHPASLGPAIVNEFAREYGKKAYIVNPPDVDELEPVARVSGLADFPRESRFHALSHKEVGQRGARDLGKRYEEVNLVIAHIGGGISVAAHRLGRAVDATDILNGECPMAPTRSGVIAPAQVLALAASGKYSQKELRDLFIKNGGIVNHLGTSDVIEVKKMIADGNEYARLVYDGMIYQVAKDIGAFATVLNGKVDAIILTGGIVNDDYLVEKLSGMVGYIAKILVYPGELEMEGLASGALRVIRGEEKPQVYTGEPQWCGFEGYGKKAGLDNVMVR